MSRLPETAQVLRRLLERRDAGMELDPWLPFPQKGCCFFFGPQKQPVPIGALSLLWSAGSPYVQPCQACGKPAYMISFGGLLSGGGGTLVCPSCGHSFRIGGLGRVRDLLATGPLGGTEFRPTGALFGGVIDSDGRRLCELLGVRVPTDDASETRMRIAGGPAITMALDFETLQASAKQGSPGGS